MDLLKKHYEKIILSIVLLGLAAAAALLPLMVGEIKQQVEQQISKPPPKSYSPVNLETNAMVLQRLKDAPTVALSGPHNLFNPVQWQKMPGSGDMIPLRTGNELGPNAVNIIKITPLYLTIEFDKAAGQANRPRYTFYVTDEASEKRADRKRRSRTAYLGQTAEVILLKEVKGDPMQPTELVLEIIDTKQEISVTPTQPYQAIAGYAADLRYEPEKKTKNNARKGETWAFAGDDFKVVVVDEGSVTLQSESREKRFTIELNQAQ